MNISLHLELNKTISHVYISAHCFQITVAYLPWLTVDHKVKTTANKPLVKLGFHASEKPVL